MADDRRFERVFEVSPDPMSLSTVDEARFIDVNDAFLKVFGYTREEVIGHTGIELNIWADPADRARIVDELRARGVARDHEIRFRTRAGEERILLVSGAIIGDARQPLILFAARDLTERYRMEAALRDSEARYRRFIEELPLGIVITQGGVIKLTNAQLRGMLGYTAAELEGQSFLPLVHVDDRAWLVDLHQRRMRGEDVPDIYECRFLTRSGAVRHWRLVTRTIDWDGPASHGVVTDITELKEAEAQLRLAASVFDQSQEGIMITDAAMDIIAVNAAFTRITGYARDEVLGRNPRLLKSDRHDAQHYAAMRRALEEHGEWQGEFWNRRRDGALFAVQESVSRVCDAAGRTSHYVALFADITDAKRHQQELERMAHFDALTGLPNRVLLADRMKLALAQAERSRNLLAVCYLDLDGFKPINDAFGHQAGDRLLVEIAHRLSRSVRGGDTVARLGGDEFALLLGGLASIAECEGALARILEAVAAPTDIDGQTFSVSASVGVTLFPIDHADADALLRNADQAMYAAKQAGRNRYRLFDAGRS
jgi:diguanylate cyclase (GGDEF)-like protein/PAS domain S-box-containing protein